MKKESNILGRAKDLITGRQKQVLKDALKAKIDDILKGNPMGASQVKPGAAARELAGKHTTTELGKMLDSEARKVLASRIGLGTAAVGVPALGVGYMASGEKTAQIAPNTPTHSDRQKADQLQREQEMKQQVTGYLTEMVDRLRGKRVNNNIK